jgi:hypothetical protein
MPDISSFSNKAIQPNDMDLAANLGTTYRLWIQIREFVYQKYPNGSEDWNFPGKNYGWSFRIKDKKRAILYFLPRYNYFKVAFVFGQKALDYIIETNISESIKKDLLAAKKYVEGRGVRIDVKDETIIPDIQKLIEIKLAY